MLRCTKHPRSQTKSALNYRVYQEKPPARRPLLTNTGTPTYLPMTPPTQHSGGAQHGAPFSRGAPAARHTSPDADERHRDPGGGAGGGGLLGRRERRDAARREGAGGLHAQVRGRGAFLLLMFVRVRTAWLARFIFVLLGMAQQLCHPMSVTGLRSNRFAVKT